MYSEIDSFIKNYDSYEYYDYSEEDIANVESFLEALLSKVDTPEKKDKKEEKSTAKNNVTTLSLVSPTDFEDVEHEEKNIEEDVIAFSFECNDDIVKIACVDEELYVIEENDYEIALNQAQMEFIVECYAKILKIQKDKPRS